MEVDVIEWTTHQQRRRVEAGREREGLRGLVGQRKGEGREKGRGGETDWRREAEREEGVRKGRREMD